MNNIGATREPAAAAPKPRPADSPTIVTTSTFSWYTLWAALGLITATLIVYAPVRHYGFVAIDDPAYVTENPHISNGLTWHSIVWAFTSGYASNWHPLTWLSHMLDVQLFGMNAGPHHVVSLALHIINTILLFWLMVRLTGTLGRSAFVSGLFALHPLHVESVAWVAERKDVLSTMFWLLTLLAYAAYVRRPGLSRYLVVCVSFALGLLAKPMLVTIPFVLLLLDVWPLCRITWGDGASGRRQLSSPHRRAVWVKLICEKLPMIALSVASSIVTFLVQERAGAVTGLNLYPLALRTENVLVSYAAYISKMLWPVRLTMLYPYSQSISGWWVSWAFLFLLGVSFAVIRAGRRHPYLPVGWFWYLGTLIPVIGLVQVGIQSMADRYTYIPLIGLFVMASWGVPDMVKHLPYLRRAIPVLAMLLILACGMSTRHQLMYWKSSDALWAHAFEVTFNMDNWNTHNNLGVVLRNQGRVDEALAHFSVAVRMKPDFAEAHHNLGATLAMLGRMDEAIASLSEALRLKPDFAEAHGDLGFASRAAGRQARPSPTTPSPCAFNRKMLGCTTLLALPWQEKKGLRMPYSNIRKPLASSPIMQRLTTIWGFCWQARGK